MVGRWQVERWARKSQFRTCARLLLHGHVTHAQVRKIFRGNEQTCADRVRAHDRCVRDHRSRKERKRDNGWSEKDELAKERKREIGVSPTPPHPSPPKKNKTAKKKVIKSYMKITYPVGVMLKRPSTKDCRQLKASYMSTSCS